MKVEHSLLKVRILREYRFHVPIHHFFIKFRDNLESSQKLKIHHLQPISSFAKIIGIDSGTAPAREILERVCTCYAQCRKHTGQEVGGSRDQGLAALGSIELILLWVDPLAQSHPVSLPKYHAQEILFPLGGVIGLKNQKKKGNTRLREGGVVGRIQVALWRQEEAEI